MKRLIIKKSVFILYLCLSCLYSSSQNKYEGGRFLDGKLIGPVNVYINPERIESVYMTRFKGGGGSNLYITTKEKFTKFLSLSDLLEKYTNYKDRQVDLLFNIDSCFVEDTTGILIDQSFYIKVDTFNLSNAKYLKRYYPYLRIIDIKLYVKKPPIRFRMKGKLITSETKKED